MSKTSLEPPRRHFQQRCHLRHDLAVYADRPSRSNSFFNFPDRAGWRVPRGPYRPRTPIKHRPAPRVQQVFSGVGNFSSAVVSHSFVSGYIRSPAVRSARAHPLPPPRARESSTLDRRLGRVSPVPVRGATRSPPAAGGARGTRGTCSQHLRGPQAARAAGVPALPAGYP